MLRMSDGPPLHDVELLEGDAAVVLTGLRPESVHCIITSPPYWMGWGRAEGEIPPGLLGLEPSPARYVERLVALLSGLRRVLREDGRFWLVVGDPPDPAGQGRGLVSRLVGALVRDGWVLRRCLAPIRLDLTQTYVIELARAALPTGPELSITGADLTSPASPSPIAFSLLPERLVAKLVPLGSAPGQTVLDPLCGSGTVGLVAVRAGRRFIGIELNPHSLAVARRRLSQTISPLIRRNSQ
jgi:site-specific DNA-methyltransferase (cytosine-N4-specific)